MPDLSPRLKTAADMVRNGATVIDIGTDHAFLPAYLITAEIAEKALATDIRKGPLLNAAKTLRMFSCEERVELRLSDGFENIKPNDGTDIIICGMGGTLIAEMLEKAPWLKDRKYRLIIQPQSHHENVREYLINNGFEILSDKLCFDSGRIYNVFCAEFRGEIRHYSISYVYTGEIRWDSSEEVRVYFSRMLNHLRKKSRYSENKKRLESVIKEIEEKYNEHFGNL